MRAELMGCKVALTRGTHCELNEGVPALCVIPRMANLLAEYAAVFVYPVHNVKSFA